VPEAFAPADATWGVFAAEGPGVKLEATPDGDGGWLLSGTKPWCSLADRLSHALVTAWLPSGERGLFAVPLTRGGVRVQDGVWHAVGLADVASGPVDFDRVPAAAVGDAGWYLRRPGFAWGGIGVAACWFGGAVGVARAVPQAASRREPDQIGLMHVGRLEAALTTGRLALRDAAELVDARAGLAASDPGLLAGRTRTIIADVAELVLGEAARALGPAPLALDARHARRVADLSLYLRQHHAERDEAAIGRAVLGGGVDW
jgi:alkylation response protein AidB-like acyl-CoA dehydrogenase